MFISASNFICHFDATLPLSYFRNMVHQHEDILKCLRNKSVSELTKFRFEDNPSFLTAMGPSRDGIIIPADFGLNNGKIKTRQGRSSDDDPFSSDPLVKSRVARKLRSQSTKDYEVMLDVDILIHIQRIHLLKQCMYSKKCLSF